MNDDARLREHVRPPGWRNPSPAPRYDLVVIGGGTAGLVCAAGASGLGARVALVERALLGGECLNTGCVPSKSLLRSARAASEMHGAASLGMTAAGPPDFGAVMARLRARRADLAPHDSAERLKSLGVDVFFGTAAFSSPRSVTVRSNGSNAADDSGVVLRFRKAVIATGSRPLVPDIPGLAGTPFLTSDTLFDLTDRPKSLIVIGAGPTGCEMAQAFAGLGTRVTLVESSPHVLPNEDAEAGAILGDRLRKDGVELRLGAAIAAVRWSQGCFVLDGAGPAMSAEAVLVATGRTPCADGLDLDAAGVAHDAKGVTADDFLRTTNRRVFAAGDVCSRLKFTHMADAMARIVIQNALFFGRRRVSALVVPSCTFTSPQVAHVGRTVAEASASGADTITIPLSSVDRAVVDEATAGFLRIHHTGGRIVGATIVAPEAGEMIGTIVLAMQHGHGLADLASVSFPYPTVSLALRQAGDAYRRSRLTPVVRALLRYYLSAFR
ncbi:MAG TPA: mercuric reductase [Vicinamibacterales bacterium]|nr:mercuric reductase [Vicinamibacterales bacterium]